MKHWCLTEDEARSVINFIEAIDPEAKPEIHYVKYPKVATPTLDKYSAITLIYITWDWINPIYPEYISIL